ncbi:hypothetical protein SCHPADRAFT_946464 [Schizopora paradoxa]|uniref:Uncharacterized protein n=1 Tax=Schizopora paradoxa TaxID=27342 RepID=A0A0H2R949_9AGAM|nr:hypothetical protein SCHPADRAFT_946464 [Schizopora paradoxa]
MDPYARYDSYYTSRRIDSPAPMIVTAASQFELPPSQNASMILNDENYPNYGGIINAQNAHYNTRTSSSGSFVTVFDIDLENLVFDFKEVMTTAMQAYANEATLELANAVNEANILYSKAQGMKRKGSYREGLLEQVDAMVPGLQHLNSAVIASRMQATKKIRTTSSFRKLSYEDKQRIESNYYQARRAFTDLVKRQSRSEQTPSPTTPTRSTL